MQGPFTAKTCYVDQAERVRMQVSLGLRASLVVEAKMKNLDLKGVGQDALKSVKACLIIILGGQHLVIDEVEDPWDGVHPARFFVRCKNAPDAVEVRDYGAKSYMDLGEYLEAVGRSVDFRPDDVKRDFVGRK